MVKKLNITNTLQFKINLVFGVMFTVALLLMMVISVKFVGSALNQSEQARITQVAKSIALELEKKQAYIEQLANNLVQLVEINQNKQQLVPLIYRRLEKEVTQPLVAGGGVWPEPYTLDPSQERASLFWGRTKQHFTFFNDYNNPNEPSYREALWYLGSKFISSGCFWSSAYQDPYTKELMTTCAEPIYINDGFWGVATIDISLKGTAQLLDRYMEKVKGYALIVDRNARVLAYSTPAAIKQQLNIDTKQANFATPVLFSKLTEFPQYQNLITKINTYREQYHFGKSPLDSLSALKNRDKDYLDIEQSELIKAYLNYHNKAQMVTLHTTMQDPITQDDAQVMMFHLPKTDNYLAIVVPQQVVLDRGKEVALLLLLFLMISLCICVLGMRYWLRKTLLIPLNNMINTLHSEDESPLDTSCKHELSELAQAYNDKQSELQRSKQIIEAEKDRYHGILSSSHEAVIVIDESLTIHEVNPAALALLGVSQAELTKKVFSDFLAKTEKPSFKQWVDALVQGDQSPTKNEFILLYSDKRAIYAEFSVSTCVIDQETLITLFIRDVSERRIAEQTMTRLATIDNLTGLLNRVSFNTRLEQALSSAKKKNDKVVLLFIDLDFFKEINDVRGHEIGDKLLVEVAKRLREKRRSSDIVARLGGDEFAIILKMGQSLDVVSRICCEIIDSLNQPFHIVGTQECKIGASIGISVYPDQAQDATELMRQADIAMYQAKGDGRNVWRFFAKEQFDAYQKRQQLLQDMKKALELEQFYLDYQPIIDNHGEVVFLESLIRWRHPERGIVPPLEFIPLAEKSGLIVDIGNWIIGQVCAQIQQWIVQGFVPPAVSINVSAVQLQRGNLGDVIMEQLLKHGLSSKHIILEMTESLLIESASTNDLQQLRSQGLAIAIDDFGTGYSSLAYLQTHPVDILKIDKAFVSAIDEKQDSTLCYAIINLAKGLNTKVIAEGVEYQWQFAKLNEMGCHYFQGYWISKPMQSDAAIKWVSEFELQKLA